MDSSDSRNRFHDLENDGSTDGTNGKLCNAVIDNIKHALHVVDREYRFRIFNPLFRDWCRELGVDTTDIEKKTVFEVFPFLSDNVRNEYKLIFETGKTLITEDEVMVGDKKIITETHKFPLRINGSMEYVATVVHDITRQRQAEDKLRQSEEKYRLLVEKSFQGIIIFRPGQIVYVNQKMAEIAGLTVDEIMKMSPDEVLEYTHSEDTPEIKLRIEAWLSGENLPQPHRFRGINKKGEMKWLESYSSLISYEGEPAIQTAMIDVTERVEAEQAMRESMQKYRALFEQATESIVLFKADTGEMVEFNEVAHKNLGYDASEFRKLSVASFDVIFTKPEQRNKVKDEIIEKGSYTFETRQKTRNGEFKDVIVSATYIELDNEGYILSLWRDITRQKAIEETLRKSEEALRAQYQSIPVPTYTWENREDDFVLVEYNRAAEKITKNKIKKHLGARLSQLYAANPEIQKLMRDCYEKKSTIRQEMNYRMLTSGKIKHFNIQLAFVPPNRILVHTEDISDRKKAEESLRKSEERHRVLLENVSASISVFSREGEVLFVNEFAARNFGLKPEQLLGTTMWDAFPGEIADEQMTKIRDVIDNNRPFRGEAKSQIKGELRWFDIIIQAYRIESDEINAALVIAYDITERKQAEFDLKQARDGLERRIKERTEELAEANEQLQVEREALRQKNIALQEVLYQIEEGKQQIGKQIQSNIDRIVKPILKTLENKLNESTKPYLELLKSNLDDISSPFINHLESKFSRLTPREIEVCNMIKNGMTCKDIAEILHISVQTVLKQRAIIRKKLGLTNQKVNLSSFLLSNK